jgi:hypothetical protein
LEDRTKRGLEVRERYVDGKYGAECESGIIYDGRGTRHKVAIRWFFPKSIFILDQVVAFAEGIDRRYLAIRVRVLLLNELTIEMNFSGD